MFAQDYQQQLFYMLRDYSLSIPTEYRAEVVQGAIELDDEKLGTPGLTLGSNLPFDI